MALINECHTEIVIPRTGRPCKMIPAPIIDLVHGMKIDFKCTMFQISLICLYPSKQKIKARWQSSGCLPRRPLHHLVSQENDCQVIQVLRKHEFSRFHGWFLQYFFHLYHDVLILINSLDVHLTNKRKAG